jgi:hypothetical protein
MIPFGVVKDRQSKGHVFVVNPVQGHDHRMRLSEPEQRENQNRKISHKNNAITDRYLFLNSDSYLITENL